jgi:hypothetical protein
MQSEELFTGEALILECIIAKAIIILIPKGWHLSARGVNPLKDAQI